MNSVTIIIISAATFIAAYVFYARKLETIFSVDPTRPTPAYTKEDGLDYIPAKNWLVLFGHHFSSIAGAGPIVGPVIAVMVWGWAPALIWIIVGSIFLGSIHDFGSLMISIREDGATIGDVALRTISHRAKLVLSIFTFLALILVIAVFAYFAADTFVQQPEIVVPSLGIIPVAVLVGLAMYRFKWNTALTTVAGLTALGILIVVGHAVPVYAGENSLTIWMVVLLAYCYIASIIPVNILLQPRDYLSSFLLVFGIVLAFGGIFLSHPGMNTPAFITNKSSLGYLWPMMFITIACGANSGFHALIASGTTSKQLSNERDAKKVVTGAMLLEGFLASVVIVLVSGGFSLAEFNMHVESETSPINVYGIAFGNLTAPFLAGWGGYIALTILNAFILTTLDSATRITRYIGHELFGYKNRYVLTAAIVILAGWLALGKDTSNTPIWKIIWPAFGASNQLVAALALLVVSCWLLSKNKPVLYSLIPSFFMLMTSSTALIFQLIAYCQKGQIVLIVITLVLLFSALFLSLEVAALFRRKLFSRRIS